MHMIQFLHLQAERSFTPSFTTPIPVLLAIILILEVFHYPDTLPAPNKGEIGDLPTESDLLARPETGLLLGTITFRSDSSTKKVLAIDGGVGLKQAAGDAPSKGKTV